ncbi:Cerato-platanin-domain-containing protein [Aspergillus recurvatus]
MKLATLLPAFAAAALAAPSNPLAARQSSGTSTLSYDTKYDVADTSLTTVACSDGDFGLITEGYTTFGSLPTFARIGGAPTIASWGSPNCGSCYQLSYTSATGATNSIIVTAVDTAPGGFNVGQQAMNQLTGGRAAEVGRVDITWTQVGREQCGLSARP